MEMKDEIRKGPWTEEEDMQLMWFVGLLGERRWDFIAKVSGLQRTGKSCRLRWVNYLNPSLKRGRLSPQEERLVLELHARWGNRWSRIARKLPGRTDNEIKNYWRTHMRKEAQRRKKSDCNTSPASSSSALYSPAASTSSSSFVSVAEHQLPEQPKPEPQQIKAEVTTLPMEGYPMEKIWDEMASFEEKFIPSCNLTITGMGSPFLWDNYSCASDALWKMGMDIDEELKSPFPATGISK